MNAPRRVVQRAEVDRHEGFDAQLWPVFIALAVLCGVTLGTIVTFLRGPWLWASLLAMPVAASIVAWTLSLIEHRWVKRSLQLALLLSIAIHLAMLTGAFHTAVFGPKQLAEQSTPRQIQRRTVRRPVDFPNDNWTDLNPVEMPEVEQTPEQVTREEPMEVERPQPVPVEQPQEVERPAIERRPQDAPTTPRQQESLSELSRQTASDQPQSSTQADVARSSEVPEASSAAAEAQSQVAPERMAAAAPSRTQADDQTLQPAASSTRREREMAVPTESTAVAQSRTERSDPAAAATEVTAQTTAPAMTEPSTTRAEANSTTLAAAAQTSSPEGRTAAPELDSVQVPQPQAERRTSSESEPAATIARSNLSTPSTPRETARPDLADRADTTAASQAPSPTLEATASTGGQSTAATESQRNVARSDSPSESNPIASSSTQQRRAQSEAPASSAALASNPTQRREAPTTLPTDTPVESSQIPTSRTARATPAVAPSSTEVAQRSTQAERSTQVRPSDAPSSSAVAQTPRATRSEQPSAEPSLHSNLAAQSSPRRTLSASPEAASPQSVETPAIAGSNQGPTSAAAEAQALAVNQAEQGTAGRGRSANMESATAAAERPALQSSNSARRESATRANDQGLALAPSEMSDNARNRAQSPTPSSTIAAETTDNSSRSGSEQVREVVATAGATLTEAEADVRESNETALAGTGEVDIGAIKVVSESGLDRGSGGGQPELSSNPQPLAEGSASRTGQAPSVAANTVADVPTAPIAPGGGQPEMIDAGGESLAADESGGAASQTRGATAGDPSDETTFETGSPVSGAETLARSRRETSGELAADSDAALQTSQGRRASSLDGPNTSADVESLAQGEGMSGEDEDEEEEARLAAAGSAGPIPADQSMATRRGGDSPGEPPSDDEPIGSLAEDAGPSRRGRSESATAAPGALALGGGDGRPRASSTPATSTDAQVTLGSGSSPGNQGEPLANSGDQATGAGSSRVEPSAAAGGGRSSAPGEAGGELLAGGSEANLPNRRTRPGELENQGNLPSTTRGRVGNDVGGPAETTVDLGQFSGGTGGQAQTPAGDSADLAQGESVMTERTVAGGVRVELDAEEGPGGLGAEYSSEVGVNDRRARADDAPLQAMVDSRFQRRDAGGTPGTSSAAAVSTEAFRDRERMNPGREGGPQTEEAIEKGLAFLARYQEPTGNWILERYGNGLGDLTDETPQTRSDTAATGLALLAFQGAGYNHLEYRYADQMRRAIDWLIQHQKADGDLFVESSDESNQYARLYSHGIAALALSEAYGITQDPRLKEPAQRALDYIMQTQDKALGGWRYTPGLSSDTSVTGWMMMALKSGQLAGLEVDEASYRRIESWLEQAAVPDQPGEYRYNPLAYDTDDQRHGREASPSMTAVGLLMRLYLGADRDSPEIRQGAEVLLRTLPSDENSRARDTYYWYYATQIIRHVDGEPWQRWSGQLRPLLLNSQVQQGEFAGSWDPLAPVPDRWSLHGGRLYLTTMNLLSLEVDYRMLPLYEDTVE